MVVPSVLQIPEDWGLMQNDPLELNYLRVVAIVWGIIGCRGSHHVCVG